jgi:hypothetical protein
LTLTVAKAQIPEPYQPKESLQMGMPSHRRSEKAIQNQFGQGEKGRFKRLFLALTSVAFAGLGCSSGGGTPAPTQGGATQGGATQGGTTQVTPGSGGSSQGTGGTVATGGAPAVGGSVSTGGTSTSAGGSKSTGGMTPGTGGEISSGGTVVTAGSIASGGATPKGGTTGSGGTAPGTGGSAVTGGTTPKGGTTGSGGSIGGAPGTGGQTSTTPGSCPTIPSGPTPDATTRAKCTSISNGIACHFGGDVGNYNVSFNLGGTAAGQTQVQAETWREMLAAPITTEGTPVASIATTAGQKLLYSMAVNVRKPEGQPNWTVSAGTDGLDMYFIGSAPQLDSIAYAPAPASQPVLYILTDSTGCDQPGDGSPGNTSTAGWGQWLPQFFGPGIAVANYGNSGALTECSPTTTPCESDLYRSFYDDPKMWPAIKPLLKAGDVVLIEFAHNDKQTPQDQYEANLNKYINETKAAGAIPLLATPIPRNNWTNATTMNTSQLINNLKPGVDLPASIRKVGAAAGVPVIDILAKVMAFFNTKGQTTVTGYYADAQTHLKTVGANIVATILRDEIRSMNLSPLVCYLR